MVDNDDDCDFEFSDSEWKEVKTVKTVESVDEFPDGWRTAVLYTLIKNPKRACLYFGDEEYEGLDPNEPYTFTDGVLRDGGGVRIELFEESVTRDRDTVVNTDKSNVVIVDPELEELEVNGGGYLSNSSDDDDFMIDGDGDKKIVSM